MNRLTKVVLAPADADDDCVALSQTPIAAADLTLNGAAVSGGVATFDMARRVRITVAADESARTFTITGTDRYGRPLIESIAGRGSAGTEDTVNDFLTVSEVAVDDATADAIKVGTGGVLSGPWLPVDWKKSQNLGFDVEPTGTVNYTVEHTFDDPQSAGVGNLGPGPVQSPVLTPFPHGTVASKTDNQGGFYTGQPITAVRVTINSYSSGAIVTANFVPGGILAVE